MQYRDLREWLDHLEKEGELLRIKEEINLEPDVGAIGQALTKINGPAILAEKIVGYRNERLSMYLLGSMQRTGMALGLPREKVSPKEQKEAWLKAYNKYPIKPMTVASKDAPCKENILRGQEVNLFNFPIPKINIEDGAPYILKTMCITKDPDSDWINFGIFRLMVLGRNKTSIFTSHTSHWGQHYTKSRQRGKPLEMAVALGTDPILIMVSGVRIPAGWNEFDFAGALRGEPVELIKAESVDLPVPATAEIVLEGIVTPEADVFEGPFGEFTGAYSGALMMPTFEINTITHRNDPIFDTVHIGVTGSDNRMDTISVCAALEQELKHICPSVTEVSYLLPECLNCVVQGKWTSRTEPLRIMNAVWASEANSQSKMVTIVDDDVDPWNADEVMWAIAARCQANTDVVMIPGAHCRLDPSQEINSTTCKFGIDATKSMEPYPRHIMSDWITTRKETSTWKEKILKLMEGVKL